MAAPRRQPLSCPDGISGTVGGGLWGGGEGGRRGRAARGQTPRVVGLCAAVCWRRPAGLDAGFWLHGSPLDARRGGPGGTASRGRGLGGATIAMARLHKPDSGKERLGRPARRTDHPAVGRHHPPAAAGHWPTAKVASCTRRGWVTRVGRGPAPAQAPLAMHVGARAVGAGWWEGGLWSRQGGGGGGGSPPASRIDPWARDQERSTTRTGYRGGVASV